MSENPSHVPSVLSSTVPRIDAIKPVATTKWLSLKTISYTDQEGKPREWDVATRTTKRSPDSPDAVIIVPLLRRRGGSQSDVETLLVEQYRPPVGRTTVEFPAGLIDEGESPEEAALRELREETGYVGSSCSQASREVCMSPGLTDESVSLVLVDVDLDDPRNAGSPQQNLDDGEHVTVRRVGLTAGLRAALDGGGCMPIEGLYLFALGLELGIQLGSGDSGKN
eukprot:CAMPEP_0183292112 /NCGR_PEP_ID=MMETSP0160_2-20130417/1296_1 /TAXON_ID=2839 ORGANISM="Odontella Sinensis, Strain Grunow 1884" /NCGR_SAMPLE_ID=MMETSP0160_2 /ASSEMBLY_ACC=CAM_ASM_000250 /LENGTH=223 /DNA_ID=CAMNT_0025453023 /DNA_START=30 /DNA_END=701 /DNA_ORIENTATION=+